jgi:non-heme chloroperoxidase
VAGLQPGASQDELTELATEHPALRDLDIDDAAIVGASMGASVIWAYCDVFGTDRISRIVTVDQTPKMVNDKDWDLGFYGLTWDGVNEFVTTFPAGRVPFHTVPPNEVLQLMMRPSNFSFETTRALLRDHTVADWRDVMPRIDVPLLAIAGRHCPFWPPASSEFVAKTAPYGDVAILEDSGHVPFLEQPDEFNEILGGFLS